MNGGLGRRTYGFCSTRETVKDAPSSRVARPRAVSDALPVEADEPRLERLGVERRREVPPARRDERHPLALALDDEPRRHGLHAAGGEPPHDLLPEHRRDLVAVEPVQDPPRLLRVDEPLVDLARLAECTLDRVAGDLVEDHPAHRNLRLQHLEEMPGDRLALTVLVRREQELVGAGEQLLQLAHLLPLVRIDDVERLEVVLDVHAEPGPGLLLVLLRNVGGALWKVADVADAGFDHEVLAEVARDGLRLCGRLDDDETLVLSLCRHGWSR
jgi:hypothetical protein